MATLKHTKMAMREQGFTAPALGELSKSEVAYWQEQHMTADQRASVLEEATARDIWGRLGDAARSAMLNGRREDGRFTSAMSATLAHHVPMECLDLKAQHPFTILSPLGRAVVKHGKVAEEAAARGPDGQGRWPMRGGHR